MMGEHKTNHRKKWPIEQERQVWYTTLKERALMGIWVDGLEAVAMTAGKYGYGKITQDPARADQVRNWVCKKFREVIAKDGRAPLETDTMIMLDNDHLHHPYTLPRLASQITDRAGGRGVVSGLAFRRTPPYDPLCFVRGEDGALHNIVPDRDELLRCDMVATCAIAIAAWVFDDLEAAGCRYPWFRYSYADDNDTMPGEDSYFGATCEGTGISMWVDGGLVAPHFTPRFIARADMEAYLKLHPELIGKSVAVKASATERIEMEAVC